MESVTPPNSQIQLEFIGFFFKSPTLFEESMKNNWYIP